MNLGGFHLIDDTSIDTPIINRDYMKIYHQQGAESNVNNHCIDFLCGKNNKNYQIVLLISDSIEHSEKWKCF